MRIGSKMLDAFGIADNWLPRGSHVLPPHHSAVHTISRAFVFSSSGIIGLDTGEVLEDTLDHTDPAIDGYERRDEHEVLQNNGYMRPEGGAVLLPGDFIGLPGRYLSLLLGNYDNHFHWLLMNFARIALLEPDDFGHLDGILVPADLTATQLEALHLARLVDHAPLRAVGRGESLQVGKLILPWNIASGDGINPVAVDYLRHLVPARPKPNPQRASRKIYIDRRNALLRQLINEDEVVERIRREGVEPVQMEGLSLTEQIQILRDADLIIGPHGAGLTNIVFSNPGTKVIELMPSGAVNWCYRNLAAACRHDYDCIIGRTHPEGDIAPMWAPWFVSPTHVLSAIE
jgi:capsular polysaccharide biosynthesis protein